jgi:mannosyl-oligosaccharide alpha-1,2-mannosidase
MQPLSAEMVEIRQATADAWSAYAGTGMAGDDLRPIQGGTTDYMHVHATLYDSLDTLYVMGLHAEFEAAVESAVALGAPRTLMFPTSSFEYNIRIIGGLLSAAQLSGDPRLLSLASDAAHTLLSSAYVLWPSPLMMDRVRMQPLTLRNFPFWLTARVMDTAWMLWQCALHGQSSSRLAKVKAKKCSESRARVCQSLLSRPWM